MRFHSCDLIQEQADYCATPGSLLRDPPKTRFVKEFDFCLEPYKCHFRGHFIIFVINGRKQ
jgi:hypothetical protein